MAMRIRVTGGVGDLARTQARNSSQAPKKFSTAVRRTERYTTGLVRSIARAKSGPHGAAYYKRITGEMLGPLTAEIGPEGIPKSDFVGAGYRNGGGNADLDQARGPAGDKLAEEARRVLGQLPWQP